MFTANSNLKEYMDACKGLTDGVCVEVDEWTLNKPDITFGEAIDLMMADPNIPAQRGSDWCFYSLTLGPQLDNDTRMKLIDCLNDDMVIWQLLNQYSHKLSVEERNKLAPYMNEETLTRAISKIDNGIVALGFLKAYRHQLTEDQKNILRSTFHNLPKGFTPE